MVSGERIALKRAHRRDTIFVGRQRSIFIDNYALYRAFQNIPTIFIDNKGLDGELQIGVVQEGFLNPNPINSDSFDTAGNEYKFFHVISSEKYGARLESNVGTIKNLKNKVQKYAQNQISNIEKNYEVKEFLKDCKKYYKGKLNYDEVYITKSLEVSYTDTYSFTSSSTIPIRVPAFNPHLSEVMLRVFNKVDHAEISVRKIMFTVSYRSDVLVWCECDGKTVSGPISVQIHKIERATFYELISIIFSKKKAKIPTFTSKFFDDVEFTKKHEVKIYDQGY